MSSGKTIGCYAMVRFDTAFGLSRNILSCDVDGIQLYASRDLMARGALLTQLGNFITI